MLMCAMIKVHLARDGRELHTSLNVVERDESEKSERGV
jgi:hypothetical protein